MAKFILELVGILLILGAFGIVLLHYYVPIQVEMEDSSIGKALRLNAYVYHPLERILTPLGSYSPFATRENKIDYGSLYTYVNYSQILEEVEALNLSERPGRGGPTKSIAVLNYHGTIANGTTDEYSISVDEFKNHMYALKQAGYETVTMNELYAYLRGERTLPERSIVITFDDGLKDTYYNSDPILRALNYSAVMFVITGQSLERDSRYYLNKEELHVMHKSGRWDLQSHGHGGHTRVVIDNDGTTGPFFSNKRWIAEEHRLESDREYEDRVRADLATSRRLLEQEFNKSVNGFALPFGDFGQRESNYHGADRIVIDLSEDFYNLVFYQFKPASDKDYRANYPIRPREDFYLVMRISADSISSANDLISEIESSTALSLPYNEPFVNQKRWVSLWGNVSMRDGTMVLTNHGGTNGLMAYLDGSYSWKDYRYRMTVHDNEAQRIFLLGRFHDAENYAACAYNGRSVILYSVRDRVRETISHVRLKGPIVTSGTMLGMSITDNVVACYVGDEVVVEGKLRQIPANGGVGVRIEELHEPGSEVILDSLYVRT